MKDKLFDFFGSLFFLFLYYLACVSLIFVLCLATRIIYELLGGKIIVLTEWLCIALLCVGAFVIPAVIKSSFSFFIPESRFANIFVKIVPVAVSVIAFIIIESDPPLWCDKLIFPTSPSTIGDVVRLSILSTGFVGLADVDEGVFDDVLSKFRKK